jgi:DNA-binding LacI/PurR family transcriptional regulator
LAEFATRLKDFSAAVVVSKGPMALDVDQVVHDRFASIREVADYFVRTGRSRPRIISADYISDSKFKAFSSRLKERGLNMANENIVFLTDLSGLACGCGLADLCYETLARAIWQWRGYV